MTLDELQQELKAQRITLRASQGQLIMYPSQLLTTELRKALGAYKTELIALLEPRRALEVPPDHWLHIPELPPKKDQVQLVGDTPNANRYRVCLFGKWYILRFNLNAKKIEVTGTDLKHRAFADLDEMYKWAWAETFYTDLMFKELN